MTILLTKEMRALILFNMLKKTNFESQKKDILERTSKIAHGIAIEQIPSEFRTMAHSYPAEWFAQCSHMNWPRNDNNTPVGRDDLPSMIMSAAMYDCNVVFESVSCPINFVPSFVPELFAGVIQEAREWAVAREKLVGEMQAFLQSQRSVEKLIAAMPEIEEFVPVKKPKTFALVAPSNLLSALTEAGFPDGNNSAG